jgi:hypothetical protein
MLSMPSVKVPLGRSFWRRDFAGSVALPVVNRFYESDPTSTIDDTGLLARPGTSYTRAFGSAPMRGNFSQEGFFGGDLFVCANRTLYRWDGTTLTTLTGTLSNDDNEVSMTYQASPGVERLWLADGENLWYYEGESKSQGSLTYSAQPSDGDVVRMASVYYQYVTAGVDTGAPAGTLANPWKVLIGTTLEDSVENLGQAVDNSGTPGGTYSTALTENPDIETRRIETERLVVQARVAGVAGDAFPTTTTSITMTWAAGTLQNGGLHILIPVAVPEDDGSQQAISVTTLAAYVIIAVNASQRLYFIRPAEFWVEIFAEAETEPDRVYQVVTVGNTFWAMGANTIEPWSPTGDADIPFAPIIGRALRYGIVAGSARVLNDDVVYIASDFTVRDTSGQRVSTHAVEELIRLGA